MSCVVCDYHILLFFFTVIGILIYPCFSNIYREKDKRKRMKNGLLHRAPGCESYGKGEKEIMLCFSITPGIIHSTTVTPISLSAQ